MDTQKIELLLMDYALGATTPEVTALIEAYQETNPQVRAEVAQWRDIAAVARQAMEEKKSATPPVFPRRQLHSAGRHAQWRKAAVRITALAACLFLGYVAGSQWNNRAATPATATAVSAPVAAVENFWSMSRLRAVAERDAAQSARPSASSVRNPSVLLQQFGG
jgi:anti-sigma factor RsiW